jgi:hypothetical protein
MREEREEGRGEEKEERRKRRGSKQNERREEGSMQSKGLTQVLRANTSLKG